MTSLPNLIVKFGLKISTGLFLPIKKKVNKPITTSATHTVLGSTLSSFFLLLHHHYQLVTVAYVSVRIFTHMKYFIDCVCVFHWKLFWLIDFLYRLIVVRIENEWNWMFFVLTRKSLSSPLAKLFQACQVDSLTMKFDRKQTNKVTNFVHFF